MKITPHHGIVSLDLNILKEYAKPFAIIVIVILVAVAFGSLAVDQGASEELVFLGIAGLIGLGIIAASLKEFW